MSLTNHESRYRNADEVRLALHKKLHLLFGLTALPILVLALFVPRAFFLPAASAMCLILAFALAVYAYQKSVNYHAPRLTFWDLAGAFALLGFGAGALTDPADAGQMFGLAATGR